jgi:hypothetical protein
MKIFSAKTGILVLKIVGAICAIILMPLIFGSLFASLASFVLSPIVRFLFWIGWYDWIEQDSTRIIIWIISLVICGVISYRRGYKEGNRCGYAVGQTDGRRGIDYSQ